MADEVTKFFSESGDETLTYEKSGILGIRGELYQAKLLMLFLYRAVQRRYDFLLATEMVTAEKFDDIVFRYLDDDKVVYRFLQAKHVTDESKVIEMAELVNEGDKNFGLLKYFNSYRKIKANKAFKDKILKELMICTNIKFDKDCLKSFETIEKTDDILDLEDTCGGRFQFKADFKDKFRIYDLLRKAGPVNRLANQLAKALLFGEVIEEEKVKYVDLKKYYKFLARKVLDVNRQTFYNDFLSPCEEETSDIEIFRKILLEEIFRESNKEKQLTNKKKFFFELNTEEDILSQIKKANKKLKISNCFKQKYRQVVKNNTSEFQFQELDITSDEEINAFLRKLIFAVNQPNEDELGKIIEREIGKEFTLINSAEAVYNKLFIQMLNWMKSNEGLFISHKDGSKIFKEARRGLSVWFDVLPPSDYFTGRTTELRELHAVLQRKCLVPCVVGLGGIGKSETVRKYIQEHSQDYDHNVVWIQSENRQELEESFIRLAKDFLNISVEDKNGNLKDIKAIIASVYKWFSNKKSLFVFDNAEKFKAAADEGIDIFLPNVPKDALKPSVIITSRNQEWSESKFENINITVFTKNEAENFIQLALNDEQSRADMFKLSEILQYFPLALQQSIAYIKQVNNEISCINPEVSFTISDYLKEFDKKTKELLNFKIPDDFCDTCTKTTFTTWNITVDRIKSNKDNGLLAIEIFYIISYFAPENIPSVLFKNNVENDVRKLGSVLTMLKKYCLIDIRKGLINIHRLVQLVNRIILDESGKDRCTLIKCVEILEDNYPCGDTIEDCDRMRKMIPHFEKVLSKVDELEERGKRSVEERHINDLLRCLGNAYGTLGSILNEKKICERRVEFAQNRYGEHDPRTADALACLGTSWGDLGYYDKQYDFVKRAVDIYNARDMGRNILLNLKYCTQMSDAFTKLGTSCRHLGKLDEAEKYLEEALYITEKIHGSESHKYAHVLGDLALVHGSKGDNRTEIDMLEKSLPLLKSYYGEYHFHVGALYGKLGAAYSDMNEQQKALHLLKDSVKILERHYGPDHYQVGQTLGDMGIAHMALKQFNEAKDKLEKYLEIFESHFGMENIELEAPLSNLAFVLGCLDQRERQIALLERLLQIQINCYGPQHRKIAETRNMIKTATLRFQFFGRFASGLTIFR